MLSAVPFYGFIDVAGSIWPLSLLCTIYVLGSTRVEFFLTPTFCSIHTVQCNLLRQVSIQSDVKDKTFQNIRTEQMCRC